VLPLYHRTKKKKNAEQSFVFKESLAFIATIPLFHNLPQSERPRLAAEFVHRKFGSEEEVVTQGEMGDEFFLIWSGQAHVLMTKNGKQENVAKLKQGDYFGEGALLHNEVRNATVQSASALETISITRERFDELGFRQYVKFARRVAVGAQGEDKNKDLSMPVEYEKEAQDQMIISNAVRKNKNLMTVIALDEAKIKKIVLAAQKEEIAKGSTVISEGDFCADKFYVIHSGSVDIMKKTADEKLSVEKQVMAASENGAKWGKKLVTLGPGDSFGELALLYNAPRDATVVAAENCILWTVHRLSVQQLLANEANTRQQQLVSLIDNIDLFAPLLSEERKMLVKILTELVFKEGETIIRENEKGDTFFLLYEGTVQVSRDGVPVNELVGDHRTGEHPHFGERALLEDEPRNATITVVSKQCVVFCLPRKIFDIALGPLQSLIEGTERTGGDHMKEYQMNHIKKGGVGEKILFEDLEPIGLLGAGGFGAVTLEKHKNTKQVYANKKLSKGYICKLKMQASVTNEKNILMMTNSSFIIKMHGAFNRDQYLHFLLEPCLGGELYAVANRHGLYGRSDCARFYSASVVEAFNHLHERYIIYRDLKPENCLLFESGAMKLADMGLAKFVIGATYTTCGTPDYFAPEILLGTGHNQGVDWWALGIFLYELLDGVPPFDSPDMMVTFKKIRQGVDAIQFDAKRMPGGSIDLIKDLLQKDPSQRLPMRPQKIAGLKDHQWFKSKTFSWSKLIDGTLEPPFKPKMKENNKLGNFNCTEEDLPPTVPYTAQMDTGWDVGFEDMS